MDRVLAYHAIDSGLIPVFETLEYIFFLYPINIGTCWLVLVCILVFFASHIFFRDLRKCARTRINYGSCPLDISIALWKIHVVSACACRLFAQLAKFGKFHLMNRYKN